MFGKVYLIGAGPGDPGLLTIKAKQILQFSDCVIYDYLVNPEILSFTPIRTERIYVGKKAERHTLSQDQINELLIEKAREGKQVARLKGGDPFIFGRGGEEAEALASAGIPWEVIPGVTSAIAVPAYAGIPVTHRGYASSVAFVTAHEDPCRTTSRIQWEKLATGVDTLVFLMCASQIANIVVSLLRYGRCPSTPAAIIRWGTYSHQEIYRGTLESIAHWSEIEPPALLVVGEVVQLSESLRWFSLPSLAESK